MEMKPGSVILASNFAAGDDTHLVDPEAVGGPHEQPTFIEALCGAHIKPGYGMRFGTVSEKTSVIGLDQQIKGMDIVLEAAVSCRACQRIYKDRG